MSKPITPYLLYADDKGSIYEDEHLLALGREAWEIHQIPADQWIKLPEGGSLFQLPDRRPLGYNPSTDDLEISEKGYAVAAFVPPAYISLYTAAYDSMPDAQTLSLFCYTAVGWFEGEFYVPAMRIERDIRQDAQGFDEGIIQAGAIDKLESYPSNRLVRHLAENCYNRYECPAARNYFMGRWECPIPISPACNANCVGCISLQPDEEQITSPQDRLQFKPTVEEVVEYTVPHLMTAPYPIVSFGQGCEGEPLLMADTIADSIREIRKHTDRGLININTNASNPTALKNLMEAGLQSMRISTNSVQEKYYTPYYRPNNYQWTDVVESAKVVKGAGGWVSINYFVFPGFTDSEDEYQALRNFIQETNIDMIQWRNLNIDPDWYLHKIGFRDAQPYLGLKNMLDKISAEFPDLKFGYFNPSLERIQNYENVPQ